MATLTENKPQAAIDLKLFSRSEAAQYLGLSLDRFARISAKIEHTAIGGLKFYSKASILKYLANIQQPVLNTPQTVEN